MAIKISKHTVHYSASNWSVRMSERDESIDDKINANK